MRFLRLWGVLGVSVLLGVAGCGGRGESTGQGCRSDEDCQADYGPQWRCEPKTRVCVAFTNPPGALDGGAVDAVSRARDGGFGD